MSKIELVQQLADGHTVKEIAENTGENFHTIQKQLKKLRTEIGCPTIANLVADFLRKKLID